MSEPLKKWYVANISLRSHDDTPTGTEPCRAVYLAADVDALLGDPQALAAYLVERKKEAQP